MPGIRTFPGVTLGVPAAASLVDTGLGLADQLRTESSGGTLEVSVGASRLALIAALAAGNAMLALASATCTLGIPPADIDAVTDSEGSLVLRCGHSPPHEWDYSTGARR